MSRWIVICMLAALICGNHTESEIEDGIGRLTQTNSKHVDVQKEKTLTRRKRITPEKQIKTVKHINAADNKRIDAINHSITDAEFKGRKQLSHKINERRFVKKARNMYTDRRKIKFRRKEIKKTHEIISTETTTTTTTTNTVKVKRAEIVPDSSLLDIDMHDNKREYSSIESIEESDSEFHTANKLFLLQMKREDEESDISAINAMQSRKSNRYINFKAKGGALEDKTNNKPNRTELVQIKKHEHDDLKPQIGIKLTTKNVAPIKKRYILRKSSKKSNKTSPATRKGSVKVDNVSISDGGDGTSEKDEEETKETTEKTEIINNAKLDDVKPISDGNDMSENPDEEANEKKDKNKNNSVKISDESLSDDISEKHNKKYESKNSNATIDDYVSEKDDEETNEKTEQPETKNSSPESVSDDMPEKLNEETNEKSEIAEARNSSLEISDESVSDDMLEKHDEKRTNQTINVTEKIKKFEVKDETDSGEAYMTEKHEETTIHTVIDTEKLNYATTPNVISLQMESTEVMPRGSKSCFNKKSLRLCIKSCRNAFVDACKRIECARKPKFELRKQCKRSCKATFRH